MEKNVLLAIILSVIVIIGGSLLNSLFFPAQPEIRTEEPRQEPQREQDVSTETSEPQDQQETSQTAQAPSQETPLVAEENIPVKDIIVENEVFRLTLNTAGAVVSSIQLKKHQDNGDALEMINSSESHHSAFNLHFGSLDRDPVTAPFHYTQVNRYRHEFYRTFMAQSNGVDIPFVLRKVYTIQPDEYMIELRIVIENSVRDFPNLRRDDFAYTLSFGPQIGPEFDDLGGRGEFRKFYTFENGKRNEYKLRVGAGSNDRALIESRLTWASIAGKYFTVIGIPDQTQYQTTFSTHDIAGVEASSILAFSRPPITASTNTDVFKFYIGPKNNQLNRYNLSANNSFGINGLSIDQVNESSILGWLEVILKWMLELVNGFVNNYGISIIILTMIVKVLLYPLTHKSFISTTKMQDLNPKMQELKEKHKDNSQKLNQAMGELYKKEGVNPMSGCLPILLQMPMFIAMYGLFMKHFDLRGATFIPGWITDLSMPESVYTLSFGIPLLGNELRLLPVLYVGSQILMSKMMQTPDQSSNPQMKMMQWMMPLMFFFILYNMPSGLLVYWIATNVVTALQQMYIRNKIHKKQHAVVAASKKS